MKYIEITNDKNHKSFKARQKELERLLEDQYSKRDKLEKELTTVKVEIEKMKKLHVNYKTYNEFLESEIPENMREDYAHNC